MCIWHIFSEDTNQEQAEMGRWCQCHESRLLDSIQRALERSFASDATVDSSLKQDSAAEMINMTTLTTNQIKRCHKRWHEIFLVLSKKKIFAANQRLHKNLWGLLTHSVCESLEHETWRERSGGFKLTDWPPYHYQPFRIIQIILMSLSAQPHHGKGYHIVLYGLFFRFWLWILKKSRFF